MRDYRMQLAVAVPAAIAVVVVWWMLRRKSNGKGSGGGDISKTGVKDTTSERKSKTEYAVNARSLGVEKEGITITQRKIPETKARDRGASDLGLTAPDVTAGKISSSLPVNCINKRASNDSSSALLSNTKQISSDTVNGHIEEREKAEDSVGIKGRKEELSDIQLDQVEKLVVSAMGDGLHEAKGNLVSLQGGHVVSGLGSDNDTIVEEDDDDLEVTVTEYFDLSKSADLSNLSPDKVITCSSKAKVGFDVTEDESVGMVSHTLIEPAVSTAAADSKTHPLELSYSNVSESAAEADGQNSPIQQATYSTSLDPSAAPFLGHTASSNLPVSAETNDQTNIDSTIVTCGDLLSKQELVAKQNISHVNDTSEHIATQDTMVVSEDNLDLTIIPSSMQDSKNRLVSQSSLGPDDIDMIWGINPASRASTNWDKQLSLETSLPSSPLNRNALLKDQIPASSLITPQGQDTSNVTIGESEAGNDVECSQKPNSPVCDNNSEGSNDSGRGGSEHDATPIGSCSNEALMKFDFNMPSDLCGRFIGRHGKNINFIKTQTGARISLENNPFTADFQICQIIGTQSEVDGALAMIRRKFPIQEFPQLTMIPISVSPVSGPGSSSDQAPVVVPDVMQLSLPEGVSVEVYVSGIVDAGHVFVQQPTHPSFMSLEKLTYDLNAIYGQDDNVPAVPTPVECGVICVVENDGCWYRAMIMSPEDENGYVQVKFVDYGGYTDLPVPQLKQIRTDFMALPFQAVECFMANITPLQGEEYFTAEAGLALSEMTNYQILQCQVVARSEAGVPYIHIYQITPSMNTAVLVNRALVNSQHARWVEIL